MKYTFETEKKVDEAVASLEKILPDYGFGLQYIHNPQQKLADKGFKLDNEVKILDICNAKIAHDIFMQDMSISCAMPCKIAVYSENNQTFIVLNSLVQIIDDLNPDLIEIAQEAQDMMIEMIEEVI
jgi:uncharacterized protein (DUF302 family)